MVRTWVPVVGGLLFGAGLGLSGVANPVVINNFLDLASPTLDFTLLILFCTALAVSTVTFQLVLRILRKPIFEPSFSLPQNSTIDARLIGGALIFGIGWSLSGYCIGPSLSSVVGIYELAVPYLLAAAVGVRLSAAIPPKRS